MLASNSTVVLIVRCFDYPVSMVIYGKDRNFSDLTIIGIIVTSDLTIIGIIVTSDLTIIGIIVTGRKRY